MAEAPPAIGRKNPIQEDDVRIYMGDTQSHDLLGGQAWTTDEIRSAMKFAVMEYNELPPHVHSTTVEEMPFSNLFLKAIADQLYRMKMQQLSHELLQYQVGSTQYTDKETRFKTYAGLQKTLHEEWIQSALSIKKRQNIEDGYSDILSPYTMWGR